LTTSTGCPVFHLQPFSAAFTADPYPTFTSVRGVGPVAYDDALGMFVVSDTVEIERILADTETFSSANVVRPVNPVGPAAREILEGFHLDPVLANSDPPRHPRMRKVTARRLTPRRMRELDLEIRTRAEQLVEAIMPQPVVEFGAEVAFPLPAYTGLTLIGYPVEDFDKLKEWSRDRVSLNWGYATGDQQAQIARNLRAHWDYTERFIRARYDDPRDDMASELIAAHREDPDELTLS
jgi:cytochrome P450